MQTSDSFSAVTPPANISRRVFLYTALSGLCLPVPSVQASPPQRKNIFSLPDTRLKQLEAEKGFDGRIGVFALNTGNNEILTYRSTERFPLCSTFKVLLVGAVLIYARQSDDFMKHKVSYAKADLVTYSPVTGRNLASGMQVADLCLAALQYSDNTATNLLMKILGGPEAVTAFARSIGDYDLRLDRWETALNSAIPTDVRDTSTPQAMGISLHRLLFGDVLHWDEKNFLIDAMTGNTTGGQRIRAGIPAGWKVADKTGSGDYGTGNDIGVLWPPRQAPIIITIYTTQTTLKAPVRNDLIALAAQTVAKWSQKA